MAAPPRQLRFLLTVRLALATGRKVGQTRKNIGVALIPSEHATRMTATRGFPIGRLGGQMRRRRGAVIRLPKAVQTLQPLYHTTAMQDIQTGM